MHFLGYLEKVEEDRRMADLGFQQRVTPIRKADTAIENPYELDINSDQFKAMERARSESKYIPAPTHLSREERMAFLSGRK